MLNLVRDFSSSPFSRLYIRHSIRYACQPLVPNFLGSRSTSPRSPAALANPHDHPEGITMSYAKFGPDPLKTVAVYKEQSNTQRNIFGFIQ